MNLLNLILSPNINLSPLSQLTQLLHNPSLIRLIRCCSKLYSPIELKRFYNSTTVKNSNILKVSSIYCNIPILDINPLIIKQLRISNSICAHTFCTKIKYYENLISLNLSNNNICSNEINNVLIILPNLTYLNLWNNNIDNIGAINLAKTSLNSKINLIDLDYNYITDDGALKMFEILNPKNSNIKNITIYLSWNHISKDTMDKIKPGSHSISFKIDYRGGG